MRRGFAPLVLALALMLPWLVADAAHAQKPPEKQGPDAAASAGSAYRIGGIVVDVSAANPQAARLAGFRIAQRRAFPILWSRLSGKPASAAPRLSDSQLDGIVSGIESQGERFSMTRYMATLAVVFDRSRVVEYLGGVISMLQSPPMLLLPVWVDGGATTLFQTRTPWAAAWGRYRENATPIDYVVPAGTAVDNVLLTAFQMRRPERSTWRTVLSRYDAVDVLIAEARLIRRWPGGPLKALILARHGPDGRVLGRFVLTAEDETGLDQMLDAAARRIDGIYSEALRDGRLQAEPGLALALEPVIAPAPFFDTPVAAGAVVNDQVVGGLEMVVITPDAASFAATEAALRRVPGVTSVAVTSLSLGGSSRLLVSHLGTEADLRAALAGAGLALGTETPFPVLRRRPAPASSAAPPADAAQSAPEPADQPANLLPPATP